MFIQDGSLFKYETKMGFDLDIDGVFFVGGLFFVFLGRMQKFNRNTRYYTFYFV